jgi:hypothetical protein
MNAYCPAFCYAWPQSLLPLSQSGQYQQLHFQQYESVPSHKAQICLPTIAAKESSFFMDFLLLPPLAGVVLSMV